MVVPLFYVPPLSAIGGTMPIDPKDFEKHIKDYHRAIQSEFDSVEAGDTDKIVELIRKKFAASALELADELVMLAKNASSETAQLGSIKYAFEFLFGKEAGAKGGIEDLIASLQANDK